TPDVLCLSPFLCFPSRVLVYCKRLNFHRDLIFANFANRPRFAKNRSREPFGQYINTTETTFDSQKLEPANNLNFSALARFAKI
ncbi:MAG: hypothetical protein PV344_07495, partial [Anaplasma sp.]|nr:hypothetical protein [Anaplasma sp.]